MIISAWESELVACLGKGGRGCGCFFYCLVLARCELGLFATGCEGRRGDGMWMGCGERGGGTMRILRPFLRCAFALVGDGLSLLPERVVEFQEAVQPPDPSIVRDPLPVCTSACAHQARHPAHPPRPSLPSPNSVPLPFPLPLPSPPPLPPNTLPPNNHDSPPLQPPLHLNAIHPNHNPPTPILPRKLNMHAHIAWQHQRPER